MLTITRIEVSSNGREKLLEQPIKTNLSLTNRKEMEKYRLQLIREREKEFVNEDINIYFNYVEK